MGEHIEEEKKKEDETSFNFPLSELTLKEEELNEDDTQGSVIGDKWTKLICVEDRESECVVDCKENNNAADNLLPDKENHAVQENEVYDEFEDSMLLLMKAGVTRLGQMLRTHILEISSKIKRSDDKEEIYQKDENMEEEKKMEKEEEDGKSINLSLSELKQSNGKEEEEEEEMNEDMMQGIIVLGDNKRKLICVESSESEVVVDCGESIYEADNLLPDEENDEDQEKEDEEDHDDF